MSLVTGGMVPDVFCMSHGSLGSLSEPLKRLESFEIVKSRIGPKAPFLVFFCLTDIFYHILSSFEAGYIHKTISIFQ